MKIRPAAKARRRSTVDRWGRGERQLAGTARVAQWRPKFRRAALCLEGSSQLDRCFQALLVRQRFHFGMVGRLQPTQGTKILPLQLARGGQFATDRLRRSSHWSVKRRRWPAHWPTRRRSACGRAKCRRERALDPSADIRLNGCYQLTDEVLNKGFQFGRDIGHCVASIAEIELLGLFFVKETMQKGAICVATFLCTPAPPFLQSANRVRAVGALHW